MVDELLNRAVARGRRVRADTQRREFAAPWVHNQLCEIVVVLVDEIVRYRARERHRGEDPVEPAVVGANDPSASTKPRRNTHEDGYSPASPDHAAPFAASSSRSRALSRRHSSRLATAPLASRHCTTTSSPRSPPTALAHASRGASLSGAAWHCAISSSSVLIITSHHNVS